MSRGKTNSNTATPKRQDPRDEPTTPVRARSGEKTLPNVPRYALRPEEAAESFGVSRDFFDKNIAYELRAIRVGRLKLYPTAELERWADRRAGLALEDR